MHGIDATMGSGASSRAWAGNLTILPETQIDRSLAPGASLLPHGSTNPGATNSKCEAASAEHGRHTSDSMGCCVKIGNPGNPEEVPASSTQRELELRPEAENEQLENAVPGPWRIVRPCDVVRLINGTPLGAVINDRQFYRHRQQAPWIEHGKNRIDLLKYIAWLVVHIRRKRQPRRRRVHGRDILSLADLRDLLREQGFRCALTGQPLTPTNFALDHIVPIADGGDFTVANSQLVLKCVNRAKNTMSQQSFIEMCRSVAAFRQDGSNRPCVAEPPSESDRGMQQPQC